MAIGFDLHSFLSELRNNKEFDIFCLEEEVDKDYSGTALVFELAKRGRNPVVIFEKLKDGFSQQMVSNLFATRDLIAWSLGVQSSNLNDYLGRCLDTLIPSEIIEKGQVQDIILKDKFIDLNILPIPRHFRTDAGPYITSGMIAARDPDTGVGNLAYARLQKKSSKHFAVSLHSRQHLWDYHRRASLAKQDLPVAVVIGAHPAVMVSAAAKMGIDQDEYDYAGSLLGFPLKLCSAITVDVSVPANAEIVIEGYISHDQFEDEGPIGEYTGFMSGRSTNNIMKVTAITMREDAVYIDVIPGNSSEHLTLGRVSKEAWVFSRMKEALSFFYEFYYPTSGTHFHCYIKIRKSSEGQAKQAAQLLMGLDHYVKLVVVVDEDIDIRNEAEVLWAVATNLQADQDLSIMSGMMCNQLDPSIVTDVSSKVIIDATRKMDHTAQKVEISSEDQLWVKKTLDNHGTK